jgi:hypothetical protein
MAGLFAPRTAGMRGGGLNELHQERMGLCKFVVIVFWL